MTNNETTINFDVIENEQSILIERLLKKLNRSIVFADSQFLEWFHLSIGLETLIKDGGAFNIKKFNPFQNGDDYMKAVFFISQPLKEQVLETLKDIIRSSKFQYITLITNLNPESYDETLDYFDEIRDNCLIWMDDANFTCDLFYEKFSFVSIPFNTHSNSSFCRFFLNPLCSWSQNASSDNFNQVINVETYQRLVKQEHNGLHTLANSSVSNTKDHFQQYYQNFAQNDLNEIKSLIHSLNEMLDHLDAKEDCFNLGILSGIVANELNSSTASKQRKKASTNKVSLLLIDRNLDISMTSLFQEETTFDKMSNLFPSLNATSSDVQINLKSFLFDNKYKSMMSGNLFHNKNESCRALAEQFLVSKPKECLLEVYKKLSEVLPFSEKEKKTHRINSEALKTQIKSSLKNNKKILFENIDLIQMISAYCQINDQKSTKQFEFDKLISYIKVLTQNILNKDGPSVLTRLYGLFSEKSDGSDSNSPNYSISDLIILLIYVYSMIGEECYYGVEEEDRIKKLLIDELESDAFENDEKFKLDREFIDRINQYSNYSSLVEKFFQNLKYLKFFRKNLKQHNKLVVKDEAKKIHVYKPLVKQVCENLIKTHKSTTDQLVDIEYRTTNISEGLGSLFKSFTKNYLSASNKNHPLDNDLLIIYFIGGISSYEYKVIKETFAKEIPEKRILIGSSHFYNHNKLINYLFV